MSSEAEKTTSQANTLSNTESKEKSKEEGKKESIWQQQRVSTSYYLVIKVVFALLLYAIAALQLSEDEIRPTSCSLRIVWWLFYILSWKKVVSGKVRCTKGC